MVYVACAFCHTPVTSRALMHMQILLQSVFPLLEQRYTPCYVKLSGATVGRSWGFWRPSLHHKEIPSHFGVILTLPVIYSHYTAV